jgi:NitT/TauT family transport system permease protein
LKRAGFVMKDKQFLIVGHLLLAPILIIGWELGANLGWINPVFYGQPSGILKFLIKHTNSGALWTDLGWTLAGTFLAFIIGSTAALITGLIFVQFPRVEKLAEPYFNALNVMPRLALAPLFILWFGLGLTSKVAVGLSLSFFIVLSSTVAGMRGVSQDHLTLCKTLGAKPTTIFFKVTLPGAIPIIFSGLRLGLIYSLLGVVGTEIVASEHGIGQTITSLATSFNANGVMALVFVLAFLGVVIVRLMTSIEMYLSRWK